MTTTNVIPIRIPQLDPNNVEAVKHYTFNQTGNIMISWTDSDNEKFPVPVNDIFNEVSEFYVEMIKTISSTINPETKKPYSIYNYDAIMNVINDSGNFVQITSEDLNYKTQSFGMSFSKGLIEGLFGVASGSGGLSFAEGMITSMGNAGLRMMGSSSSDNSKVANIIFVCEYLHGLISISAVVVYCDVRANKQTFSIGPCHKESSTSTSLTMHKDVYMFNLKSTH